MVEHIEITDPQPLVSIIVPAYNAEKYVSHTLSCAMQQTMFPQIEVIVVNDGSTDRTRDMIQNYMCFRNMRCIDKPNGGFGGPGDALNVGHKAARGKFVTWWSADNIYYPNFCEVFAGALLNAEMAFHQDKGPPCELMYSDFCYIDDRGRKIHDVVHQKPQGGKDLIEGYDVGMAFMYTKALWDKTGEFWTRICEDYEWVVRAAQHTNFGLIRGVLAGFRVHGDQISGHRQEEEKSAADHCRALARQLFSEPAAPVAPEDEVIRPFA
jgi:glycosyltransferase involved in cell wall biosynthesis